MTHVLLVGSEVALLEGLAQSLAALGHDPVVATSLAEAHDLATLDAPLVLVVSRSLAIERFATRYSLTAAARASDSVLFAAGVPTLSVCP